jgi:hypothetical protein
MRFHVHKPFLGWKSLIFLVFPGFSALLRIRIKAHRAVQAMQMIRSRKMRSRATIPAGFDPLRKP